MFKTAQKVDNNDRENAEITIGSARDCDKQSRKKTVSSPWLNEDTLEKSQPALIETRTPFSDVVRCEGYLTEQVEGHGITKYYILREDGFLYSFATQEDSSFAETTLDAESTVVFCSSTDRLTLLTCDGGTKEFSASESELTMW